MQTNAETTRATLDGTSNSTPATLAMLFTRLIRVRFFLSSAALCAALSAWNVASAQTADAVTIKNFMFSPMTLTIKAGTTVTWKNLDGEPHIVVDEAGLFRSAALDQDDTYRYRFDKPGVYKVFCGIHPNMKETITVQ